MNKDLRTVVERKIAEEPQEAKAEEARVDLAALAPEGLPKDVTPEEIAALAAAAAQIKGKVVEEKPPSPVAEMPVTAPTGIDAPKTEVAEAVKAETAAQPESKETQKEEIRLTESTPALEVAAVVPPATFAEQQPSEKIEAKNTEPEIVSTQADAMTAMMGLETQMMAVHFPI